HWLCAHNRLMTLPPSFFFTDPATTAIYTLSLHDALPIFDVVAGAFVAGGGDVFALLLEELPQPPTAVRPTTVASATDQRMKRAGDRKSTRLNSSHRTISYAVFCLKKKKKKVGLNNER